MEPLKNDSFGLLIAYVLPGFIGLSALAISSETVRSWLGASSSSSPSVGGFLYVTLASTAMGLLISTIRWAVIDRIHHRTGILEPHWDFSTLQRNFAAFEGLVQSHYRYYQFYANSLVAMPMIPPRKSRTQPSTRRLLDPSNPSNPWSSLPGAIPAPSVLSVPSCSPPQRSEVLQQPPTFRSPLSALRSPLSALRFPLSEISLDTPRIPESPSRADRSVTHGTPKISHELKAVSPCPPPVCASIPEGTEN